MFTLDQYKDAALQIVPPTVDDMGLVRNRLLDARELVEQREADIRAAAGNRGSNLEPLHRQLQDAKDEMLLAQKEFERIGPFGAGLEAQRLANQQRQAQEAEAKKQEEAQLKANEAEKEAYKQELWPGYLQSGYTRGEFEKHFAEPVHGLWAQRVQQRKERRDREMAASWKDRYYSMHL